MKKTLCFVILIAIGYSGRSQDLLFKVTQSGAARRSTKSGKFTTAEVNDIKATIFLQKNKVIVDADTKASYTLIKKEAESKINNNVVAYSYNGRDEKNAAISFVYTVNLNSKEAIIEVAGNKFKNYYFGTYSKPEVSVQP